MSTCLFWTAVLTIVNQAVQRVLMLLIFMVNALVKTNFNSTRHQNFNLRFLFLRSSVEAFEVILATFIITLNWRKPGYSSLLLRKKNTKEINHKGKRDLAFRNSETWEIVKCERVIGHRVVSQAVTWQLKLFRSMGYQKLITRYGALWRARAPLRCVFIFTVGKGGRGSSYQVHVMLILWSEIGYVCDVLYEVQCDYNIICV